MIFHLCQAHLMDCQALAPDLHQGAHRQPHLLSSVQHFPFFQACRMKRAVNLWNNFCKRTPICLRNSPVVEAVLQPLKPEQAIEANLQKTWNVAANETPRRNVAQPHWKQLLQMSKQQQQHMPTVLESQHVTNESDSMFSPSLWSAPEGYQSSTSTQRNADAARDAQLENERDMDEDDFVEYWRASGRKTSTQPAQAFQHTAARFR